jgi:hypothetical protein
MTTDRKGARNVFLVNVERLASALNETMSDLVNRVEGDTG